MNQAQRRTAQLEEEINANLDIEEAGQAEQAELRQRNNEGRVVGRRRRTPGVSIIKNNYIISITIL